MTPTFAITVDGGYNWMWSFRKPLGVRSNFGGPEFGVSVGWLFGRDRAR